MANGADCSAPTGPKRRPSPSSANCFGSWKRRKTGPAAITVDSCRSRSHNQKLAGYIPPTSKKPVIKIEPPLSPIERLPNEIVHQIAGNIDSDIDFRSLNLSSPTFQRRIIEETSPVWRTRFLKSYDHPLINSPYGFSTAYKLRRLVLSNFVSFAAGLSRRMEIQLEVIREMIMETYLNAKPWQPAPDTSRNLETLEDSDTSSWIRIFFASPFPGVSKEEIYGTADAFFETVQLVLSYLLLSPKSALSGQISSSRENYDLRRVYCFGSSLSTLFICLPREAPATFHSKLFPNLTVAESHSLARKYKLDTTSLLHIRNFWHHHLNDDDLVTGEASYANMTKHLSRIGRLPNRWEKALDTDLAIPNRWFGNYSWLYPWPKTRKDLEERQSNAGDHQDPVGPMMLDFVTSDDYNDGFWPPAFSTIPVFDETIPAPNPPKIHGSTTAEACPREDTLGHDMDCQTHRFPKANQGPIYIRGIATFIDTRQHKSGHQPQQQTQTDQAPSSLPETHIEDDLLKFHPFAALRIRGAIHDICPEATLDNVPKAARKAIPGWKRIVMMLYKPNLAYLMNVLEHAMEDYGGTFLTQVTNELNTASIWGTNGNGVVPTNVTNDANPPMVNVVAIDATAIPLGQPPAVIDSDGQQSLPVPSSSSSITTTTATTTIPSTTLRDRLKTHLYTLLTTSTSSSFFPSFSSSPSSHATPPQSPPHSTNPGSIAAQVARLEDDFVHPSFLSWDDNSIDVAYAYEGVVLPGGKIMLGRWWRCHGVHGEGPGREIGTDGEGVNSDINNDEENQNNERENSENEEGQGSSEAATDEAENHHHRGSNAEGSRHRPLERGPFIFWS